MIDKTELMALISHHESFRLSNRGICIDFNAAEYGWEVFIPRAFARVDNADELEVEKDSLVVSCEGGYVGTLVVDLTMYDKLSVPAVRI